MKATTEVRECRDLSPYERLYAAMIRRVLDDFKNASETRDARVLRLEAASWLVSRTGRRWLNLGGLDHRATLEKIGWLEGARDVLATAVPTTKLELARVGMVRAALRILGR